MATRRRKAAPIQVSDPAATSTASTTASDADGPTSSSSYVARHSARGKLAGPSCLSNPVSSGGVRQDATSRGGGRGKKARGLKVTCDPEVKCVEFVHDDPLGSKPSYRRSRWLRTPTETFLRFKSVREKDKHFNLAARIAEAMCLSGLFGNVYESGWPAAWCDGECNLLHPPADGIIDDLYVGNINVVSYERMPRDTGIQLFANIWDKFYHTGDVQSDAEVELASSANTCCSCSKASLCPCCFDPLPNYHDIP